MDSLHRIGNTKQQKQLSLLKNNYSLIFYFHLIGTNTAADRRPRGLKFSTMLIMNPSFIIIIHHSPFNMN